MLSATLFQLNRPRKQNVVFEMHVLMQVLLEFGKALIEAAIGRARSLRRGVIAAELASFRQRLSR